MNNVPPYPQAEPAMQAIPMQYAAPKKSYKTLWIILGSFAVLFTLFVAGMGYFIVHTIKAIATEQAAITPVIDQFMTDMAKNDTQAAHQLFSTRTQRQIPLSAIEKMASDRNKVLFDGYKSVVINSTNLSYNYNSDKNVPQGSLATVNGITSYEDGTSGTFNALLEKENETWRLSQINVFVPDAKMKGEKE